MNSGEDTIPAGLQVSFYNGDPEAGGTLIGTTASTNDLQPSDFEDISLEWPIPSAAQAVIYARVDDDGTGTGKYEETDEANNLITFEASLCQIMPGESSLSGHIIDAVNGDLLSGVRVLLHIDNNGEPGGVVAGTESDSEGIFHFSNIAAGSYIT